MLAALPPGPELLAALVAVAPADRDPAARIDALTGWERLAGWVAGRQAEELAEFARAHPAPARGEPGFSAEAGPVDEFAAAEVAAALHLSPGSARNRLSAATELVDRLPQVRDALLTGELTAGTARLIAEHTRPLAGDAARAVTAGVLARAGGQTWWDCQILCVSA